MPGFLFHVLFRTQSRTLLCCGFARGQKLQVMGLSHSSNHPENTWSAVTMKPYICSSVSPTHCCPDSINSGIPRDQHPNLTPCACPLVSQNKSTYCCVRFWPKLGQRTNLKFSFKTWTSRGFNTMNVQSQQGHMDLQFHALQSSKSGSFPRVAVEQDSLGGLIIGFVF